MPDTTPPYEPHKRDARRLWRRVGQAALAAAVALYGIGGFPTPHDPGPSQAAAQGCVAGWDNPGCNAMVQNGGISSNTDLGSQPDTAQVERIANGQRTTLANKGVEFDFDAFEAARQQAPEKMNREQFAAVMCAGIGCGNVDDPGKELIRRGISVGRSIGDDGKPMFADRDPVTVGEIGMLFYRLKPTRTPYIPPYRPIPQEQRPPRVTSVRGSSVNEGDGTAYATLFLSHASIHSFGATVVVGNTQCSLYGCWAGTATAGEDYTARTTSINIPAGSSVGTIQVPILDDTEDEYTETLMVAFKSGSSQASCETRDHHGNPTSRPGCSTEGPRQYPTYVWTANITIYDDDEYPYPPPAMGVTGGEVVEGDRSSDGAAVRFVVSLDKTTTDDVTVTVNTSDVTATAGSDYTALVDHPVTIRAGSTAQWVNVFVLEDTVVESNETFTLTISDPVHAVLSPFTTATGTILDDDTGGFAGVCTVDSGTGFYQLSVVDIDYSTFGRHPRHTRWGLRWTDPHGTRVSPADITTGVTYTANLVEYYRDTGYNGWVTRSRDRGVLAAAECDPTTVAEPDLAVSVSDWTAAEDDGVAHVTLTLNRPHESIFIGGFGNATSPSVTLNTSDGTATAGSDYTAAVGTRISIPAGRMQTTITVPITDDTLIEPDETFTVTLSNPAAESSCYFDPYGGGGCSYGELPVLGDDTATITIVDNDDPAVTLEGPVTAVEGTQADFKVQLDKAATAAVVVTVSTGTDPFDVDPADAAGSHRDYTPLAAHQVTIPAGSLEATVSVSTVDDSIDEFDETFLLRIDSVTSTDSVQVGADDEAKGTITDDDPEPAVSIAPASAVESSGSLPFTVTLSHASQKLTNVTAATTAGSASDARGSVCATTDGSEDYRTTTSVVRFASYATTGVFDVPVCDDTAAEPDETLTVSLSSPTRATLGTPSTATGIILDDDVTPEVSISDVSAAEDNAVTFTLALDVASPRTVTVTAASAASSPMSATGVTTCSAIDGSEDYQTRRSTVSFAPNTRTAKFTVAVCDDTAVEGDETFAVTLRSPANATVSSTAGSAVGTILDDDTPPPPCGDGWIHTPGHPDADPVTGCRPGFVS